RVEQQGTACRLAVFVRLSLAPFESRLLSWSLVPGHPPVLPEPPPGVRLAVVEDGTDTWGHSLVSFGPEVAPSPATVLHVAGGPDGLVEAWGEWHERDRALKLVVPGLVVPTGLGDTGGEMPGGEWSSGPVWGRVWSYDVAGGSLRITLRR